MLAAKYRFHSRGGVSHAYRSGQTVRTPQLSLIYSHNARRKTRFAVVISKKVLKSAVGRNRVRRRLYEAIRLELPHIKAPTDHIFLAHSRELLAIPFPELQATVRDLLQIANLV